MRNQIPVFFFALAVCAAFAIYSISLNDFETGLITEQQKTFREFIALITVILAAWMLKTNKKAKR